jgi:hypothetical protein
MGTAKIITKKAASLRLFLAGLLLAAASGAARPAHAQEPSNPPAPPTPAAVEPAPPVEEQLLTTRLLAGYRFADADDDRAFLLPYDDLTSGPVVGFDLLYLKPSFGTLTVEAGLRSADDWEAEVGYGHAADLDLQVLTQKFTHAREHRPPAGEYEVPTTIVSATGVTHGEFMGGGADANPGDEYADTLYNTQASFKLRAPGYPAHFRASGRVFEHQGTAQMTYFFRSCSTEFCHVNSRTQDLDEVTQEYHLGVDAHAGPVDISYDRAFLTYRDRADDPVDAIGDMRGGLPAGDYPHDTNPDLRSFQDTLRLNSNLSNRTVLSLAYTRREQENETSGITRGTQRGALEASHLLAGGLFAVAHLDYEQERTLELSDEATALRIKNNEWHVSGKQTYQHALKPEFDRWGGDLGLRYVPRTGALFHLRGGYRVNDRAALVLKDGTAWDDGPQRSATTLAALDGRWQFGGGVAVDGSLSQEWTKDPAYAIESTSFTRYGLGATWTPAPALSLHVGYAGYRGQNDEPAALEKAYAKQYDLDDDFARETDGNSVSVLAAYTPSPAVTLSLAYSYADSGIEQDMRFGSPGDLKLSYVSPDTTWAGRTQIANLHGAWSATKRLKLTAEGVWVSGRESYDPNFAKDADLEDLGTEEVTKWYCSLGAETALTKAVRMTLTGFWTRFETTQEEGGDGRALGVLVAFDVRW